MKSLDGIIEIANSCYYNMLRSIVEPFPREPTGDLIGRKNKNKFIIVNAYPILTSKRKPTEVSYENKEAINRLRKMDKAINKLGGLGTRLIGGYHSHFYKDKEERERGLSEVDIRFIDDELSELKREYWLEAVLTLKAKNYKKPKKIGEFFRYYNKKLRIILRDTPFHAYDVIISAYNVEHEKGKLKIRELKVKRKKN